MKAPYDDDGQVCQMTIEKRHHTAKQKSMTLSSTISRRVMMNSPTNWYLRPSGDLLS
jgi:hypothetical protein